ncbi:MULTISPECIES: hypothetical protein [unclassified Xanthobacter]|uniref:hypothetical protein n=1 Tax=unclassified Xanthobacter TaxID=2623496 RepID=UPI001EE0D95A|nr:MULTISPECIES: hypothetical protein [unclassified Xanthobacter]
MVPRITVPKLPQGVGARWSRLVATPHRVGGFGAGAAVLAALALASALPPRFSATAAVTFDVGAQPPAAMVKGISQVLASREMARDVMGHLSAADVARLAAGDSLFAAAAESDAKTLADEAARRTVQAVEISAQDGGRTLRISVSTPTPNLAARLANAYVTAAVDLNAGTRATSGAGAGRLPGLSAGIPATPRLVPDLPGPVSLALLAAAIGTFGLGRRRRREPPRQGRLNPSDLPRELSSHHRISWLDGTESRGLPIADAVPLLVPHARAVPSAAAGRIRGRLLLVTSDGLPEPANACATTLARRLADEAGVVLVVLGHTGNGTEMLADLGCEVSAPGMRELLLGRARFGETLHRDPHSRAHIIPPGHLPPGSTNAMGLDPASASPLAAVLEALRHTYDYVVVANPPLVADDTALPSLDPLVVCLHADSAPATAAVESFDALARMRFSRVVMLRHETGEPPADAPLGDDLLVAAPITGPLPMPSPAPTADAESAPAEPAHMEDEPLPALRGAA